ncbi:hypothetical protein RRG08_058670 [Elysia crispata]|uniref:Uncharacterized protein n=1 Tax=Elysia crispata TaxID=231223 RepID=A0AAE1D6C0_9GAST|nr:hypothetical protein RRG08_058670 [Elysia crispata]
MRCVRLDSIGNLFSSVPFLSITSWGQNGADSLVDNNSNTTGHKMFNNIVKFSLRHKILVHTEYNVFVIKPSVASKAPSDKSLVVKLERRAGSRSRLIPPSEPAAALTLSNSNIAETTCCHVTTTRTPGPPLGKE